MGLPKKQTSITRKLTLFLALLLTAQCALFTGFLFLGGTLSQLDQNAMDRLNERVTVRMRYLENEMVQRWSNLDRTQAQINAQVQNYLAGQDRNGQNLTTRDLIPQNVDTGALYHSLTDTMLDLLRTNSVTGVFLVFKGNQPTTRPGVGQAYLQSGLCLRDMNPASNPLDNSDVTVERGTSQLFQVLDLAMDVNWKPVFRVSEDYDFYFEPLLAAEANPGTPARELGYWSSDYTLSGDNVSVVSYSQPLLDTQGQVYGVVGVEIACDYLYHLLPPDELSAEGGAYLLSTDNPEPGAYYASVASGVTARRLYDSDRLCHLLTESVHDNIYVADPDCAPAPETVYASVQDLTLYSPASPFYGQTWSLIGMLEAPSLFSVSISIGRGIFGIALLTVAMGILLALFTGNLFTRPIRSLDKSVRNLDPYRPINLPPVRIREIENLSQSIARLSEGVSAAASRLPRIIELSGVPLASFELDQTLGQPLYTQNFFSLLGLPEPSTPPTLEAFQDILTGLSPFQESSEGSHHLFRLPSQEGYRWIKLQTTEQNGNTLGVITDITPEIVEKRRLEYERDYDLLTNLLNRRAFQERLGKLERKPESLGTAAMLMMDLDNLKYLNDTYGHDCGDEYIRCAANVLRGFTVLGGLAARVSGDEFYLFLSGYGSRQALQQTIERLHEAICAATILLPNGQRHLLRASLGIAWYPDDSTSLPQLARYADFAMYTAKRESKGGRRDFNLSTYQRDAFLLYNQEELNRILEERTVDYAFQPIVSCTDGTVLGYEALMRPRSKTLSSPQDLLRVARSQSKLGHIERLTWFRAMECFSALTEMSNDCLVFINSVSSQSMRPEDEDAFIQRFGPYLSRIVIELTEEEEQNPEATARKQVICREHGLRIALDDFGSGYSSESVLLDLHPQFVKIDLSIIRGIDQDKGRQAMLSNFVSLCRNLNTQIIAEGVETSQELRTVITLGANYVQGYYTGRPTLAPAPIDAAIVAEIQQVASPEQS